MIAGLIIGFIVGWFVAGAIFLFESWLAEEKPQPKLFTTVSCGCRCGRG